MKITLVGDICANFNTDLKIDETIFFQSDLLIGNLEFPITNKKEEKFKSGPNIKGNNSDFTKILDQIRSKNIVFSLANNHMMDFGKEGLNDTIQAGKEKNIFFCGTSKDDTNFLTALNLKIDNISISIIAVCEKQFGISQINKIGVNYCDARIYKKIKEEKSRNDIVIISIHGAQEMNQWPSVQWQNQMRSYIDAGADIVHGHHSHVPQGFEKYNKGLIFYGLGNFIVNPDKWQNYKNTLWSLVTEINIEKNSITDYQITSAKIEKINDEIIINKINNTDISKYQQDCNLPLENPILLTKLWQEYSMMIYDQYYKKYLYKNNFINKNFIKRFETSIKILLNKFGKKPEKKDNIAFLYHLFCCESHKTAIETALGILCDEIEDLRDQESKKLLEKYFQL